MDKKHIGIVGAGVAGLHLGLLLRQHGVEATIITERDPQQIAGMRLLNTVAHHYVTLDRERSLGVYHWPVEEFGYSHHHHYFNLPQPLAFSGAFTSMSRGVDYRVYLPRLMQDFAERGGTLEYRELGADDLAKLAKRFDLIVVGTGRGPFGQLFEPVAEHSPFSRPQRALCVGLYTGLRPTEPRGVTLSVSPGHGELIDIPMLSFSGKVDALLLENVPGGDLEELARLRYDDDPKKFRATILAKLEKHHPSVYDRIDPARFDLQQPHDLLQGGVVPTVRRSSVDLGDGKIAIAVGDVHSVVDPVIGQGANIASYSAWVLGEEIVKSNQFDALFCERVDRRREERVLGAQRWTNFMLAPPSPEFFGFVGAMSADRALCDEFTENFNYPERQWARLATPARINGWIAEAAARGAAAQRATA
jgi:2-polyprenyl-6-methoxyphenol hydroxylase-like FAD-dependent oxidoreductase